MKRLPPLKSLQAFRFAAEELSFKQAADQLHVTQAAISQQIKTLEQFLGVTLFTRLTREVVLTDAGRQLLPYVSRGFETLEQGVERLGEDPRPELLNLTVLPSFAGRWLVPRLGSFQQQNPELSLQLSPSLTVADFEGTELDLAIRFGQGQYPGLESRLLLKEYLLPVCHPSLIDLDRPAAEQLQALPLLSDVAPEMEHIREEVLEQIGVDVDRASSRLLVSDATMLVEALLSAQGFGMLRYSLCYELLERGQLVCPLPMLLRCAYDYYLVAPQRHFNRPKVKRFESWVRHELQQVEQSFNRFCDQTGITHPEA
ncbi:LysR substrate-binding domain-containing protein [Motiliproteus coralliicola]|uniref:LysR substrate-binding domain-containing protein n=1 Tax=Motiliproteus coralliicola TaxID=2283196 RepID=UPI001FB33E56|nr:LysR substrate-binding domain-containing protein [Motiliproteus coralliicola]